MCHPVLSYKNPTFVDALKEFLDLYGWYISWDIVDPGCRSDYPYFPIQETDEDAIEFEDKRVVIDVWALHSLYDSDRDGDEGEFIKGVLEEFTEKLEAHLLSEGIQCHATSDGWRRVRICPL